MSGGVTETLIQGSISLVAAAVLRLRRQRDPTTQDLTAAQRDSVRRIRLELKLRSADADPKTEAGVSDRRLGDEPDLRNRFS